jgi:hypothetical protein
MASGTIELGGKQYTWSSPLISDLEEFEVFCGPLLGDAVNSVKGRAFLAWICLRRQNPELTLKQVRELAAEDYLKLWPMVKSAIPLWADEVPPVPPARTSPDGSSESAPSASTGAPPPPDESE